MAIEGLIPIAGSAGVWVWSNYKKEIIDSILKKIGSKARAKTAEAAKAAWERVEWELAAKKYLNRIRELYGSIRILGKSEPVSLEGIFTDVFILDRPTAFRRYDIQELSEDPKRLEQSVERLSGLQLVEENKRHRLFILGKPGAGKTTFLKYLALQATEGKLDKIPIFISLKEWADSGMALMPFLLRQFEICGFPDARLFVEHVLSRGHAIVLFDGLDEVNQEEEQRNKMIAELRDFSRQYWETQCVITCRIAASDYSFDYFTYVELADFSDEQVLTFAAKWFKDDPQKYRMFKEEIGKSENKGLRELASVPLLLALLCLSFDATLTFPQRRVEIYEEALDALLKKWDTSRSIRRDEIYRGLSHGRKRQMFARIAARTFQDSQYFIPQDKLAGQIVEYLRQLPIADTNGDIDGEVILKSIEAQHGIFSERAHRIYSFSHLTFQEYFTAKHVVDDTSGQALRGLLDIGNVLDDRWREVMLMTVSMLENADGFFNLLLASLTRLVESEPGLVRLLAWVNTKSQTLNTPQERAVGRLFYLYLALNFDFDRTMDRERARARKLAHARAHELGHTLGFDLDASTGPLMSLPRMIDQSVAENRALELDRSFDLSVELEGYFRPQINPQFALDIHLSRLLFFVRLPRSFTYESSRRLLSPKLAIYMNRIREDNQGELGGEIEELIDQFLQRTTGSANLTWAKFEDDLRGTLAQQHNVGYEWKLTKRQIEIITQFIGANRLMYDCLRLAAVTNRQAVLESLLFPPILSTEQ